MNPKVSPSIKKVTSFFGKNGVRQDLNKGIHSNIKDGGKTSSANFDLNHLDIVSSSSSASWETNSPKTSQEQLLNYSTPSSIKPSKIRNESSELGDPKQAKRVTSKKASRSDQIRSSATERGNCSSSDSQKNAEGLATCLKAPERKLWSNERSFSFEFQTTHPSSIVQRSRSVCQEETSSSLEERSYHHFPENSRRMRHKSSRLLPAVPRESTVTTSATSMTPTPCIVNNKLASNSRKSSGSGLSVHFGDNVIIPSPSSSAPKIKYSPGKTLNSKTALSTSNCRISSPISNTDQEPDHNTHRWFLKSQAQENHSASYLSEKTKRHKENLKTTPIKDSTVAKKEDDLEYYKTVNQLESKPTNELSSVSIEQFLNHKMYFEKSPNIVNIENSNLANHGLYKRVSSAPLKRSDGSKEESPQKRDTTYEWHVLLPPSLISSSSSSEDPWLSFTSDLTSSSSSVPLSQLSTPKRSSVCLKTEGITTRDLDYKFSSDLAKNDTTQAGAQQDTRLPDRKVFSALKLSKMAELGDLPYSYKSNTNVELSPTKQTIAASYHLEHCWFCGRPMLPLDSRLNGNEELQKKVLELEELLLQAQNEKLKLIQEQAKMKESEILVLKKNEALKRELETIKQREENKTQAETWPAHVNLPDASSKVPDLRELMEASGHQLDACPHIVVASTSCRGFLYKMGGRFKTWKKRWFVFDAAKRMVFYFTDKTEIKLKGSVCFQAIEEVFANHFRATKSPNPKLTFFLKTSERTYYLVAPSSSAMAVWIDMLYTCAEGYGKFYEKKCNE